MNRQRTKTHIIYNTLCREIRNTRSEIKVQELSLGQYFYKRYIFVLKESLAVQVTISTQMHIKCTFRYKYVPFGGVVP